MGITLGTHEGFLGEVKLLEEKKQRRYLLAEQWRKYQVQSLDIICEAEKKMADDEFLVRLLVLLLSLKRTHLETNSF